MVLNLYNNKANSLKCIPVTKFVSDKKKFLIKQNLLLTWKDFFVIQRNF